MNKITEIRELLKKKGWPEAEIEKAVGILASEEKSKKHIEYRKNASRVIYWMALLVLITINIIISVVLVPFLLVLKSYILYIIIGTIALMFGLIFNFLIVDLEHLERKHHLFAAIIIPLVAIINIFLIVNASNRIDDLLKINIQHNPITISVVYVFFFILPYLFSGARKI